MVCANHTGLSDPFFISFFLSTNIRVSFMAKAELFRNKILAYIMKRLNAFPVKRGEADMKAIKESIQVLKKGERLIVFPEGTRNSDSGAKAGAGMLALHTGCNILPVYITPGRKPFHRVTVCIGKSYKAEPAEGKTPNDRYHATADDILRRIYEQREMLLP